MDILLHRKVEFMGNLYFLVSSGTLTFDSIANSSRFGGIQITPCTNRPTGWLKDEEGFALLCGDPEGYEELKVGSSYELT